MVAILAAIGAMAGQTALSAEPIQRYINRGLNWVFQNADPPLEVSLELFFRGQISREKLGIWGRREGFGKEALDMIIAASRPLLQESEWITLYRRNEISRTELETALAKEGYEKAQVDKLLLATRGHPSVNDLILFALREVYNVDVREKFNLDQAFPTKFATEMLKMGYSEQDAKNYWAAHWDLPSITQGFEMFHRGVIDSDTLDVLLRAQDVMPYWRGKIKQIAYQPYTRVDVRRMFDLGILTEDETLTAYQDLGYSEDKAANLVKFTKAYNKPAERDLTRSMIMNAYDQGEMSVTATTKRLQELGYDEDEATLIIRLHDLEELERELQDKIDTIEDRFAAGIISLNEAIGRLDELDIRAEYRAKLIAQMRRTKQRNQRLPTKTDLRKMVKNGIISIHEFTEYMEKLGYTREDARRLTELLQGQITEEE